MGLSAKNPAPTFSRSVIRTEGRLMILSTCTRCNQGHLVSAHDGSLEAWEENHDCCAARTQLIVDSKQGQTAS